MTCQPVNRITVHELYALSRERPVEIVDVRTAEEYCEVRAALARHVPMDTIVPHELMRTRTLATDEPLYFICHVGARSERVCQAMTAAGFSNVVNVDGGTDAWIDAGLPVECG